MAPGPNERHPAGMAAMWIIGQSSQFGNGTQQPGLARSGRRFQLALALGPAPN
jgi:hypothetical protein